MVIAGTGHRPKYCPCLYDETHPWLLNLKSLIKDKLVEKNPSAVISGMAIGFDTWLAEVALDLKIPLWAYIPFKGQHLKWPSESKERYESILDRSEKSRIMLDRYYPYAFIVRDETMVNDCDLVFALLNPAVQSGGTFYTVNYAHKKKKEVINLWKS